MQAQAISNYVTENNLRMAKHVNETFQVTKYILVGRQWQEHIVWRSASKEFRSQNMLVD